MPDLPTLDKLNDFPVLIQLPVQWGDQDAFGHVNNTVPLRWFESSRIAFLERCGLGEMMSGQGLGPIVASVTCHYRRQIAYPDTVSVGTRVERIGRTSLVLAHAVFSHRQRGVACEGETVVVFFDYAANRPRRVPEEAREKLLSLQQHPA